MSWGLGSWIAASCAGLVVIVVAIGFAFPSDVWRLEFDGDGLSIAFLQERTAAAAEAELLLDEDFSAASDLWNVRTEPNAEVRIADGALHISVRGEETFDLEGPSLPVDTAAVRAETTAEVTSTGDRTVLGLFCAESSGPQARKSGEAGGYVFILHPQTRAVHIGRVPGPIASGLALGDSLVERSLPPDWSGRGEISLGAECDGDRDGVTLLTFIVDGFRAASVERAGTTTFDGTGVVVLNIDGPRSDVRVDSYKVIRLPD